VLTVRTQAYEDALHVLVAAFKIAGTHKVVLPGRSWLLEEHGDRVLSASLQTPRNPPNNRLTGREYYQQVLSDPTCAHKLEANGSRHIENNFSARPITAEMTQAYK